LAQIITIGNEKGGAGKSTISVHLAIACLKNNFKVAVIDLDLRQQTFASFLHNRKTWSDANNMGLVMPDIFQLPEGLDEENSHVARQIIQDAADSHDFVIIDTPGANTWSSRLAHSMADKIITPMNDSFVDFDLLAKLNPVTGQVDELNFYAHQIWEARKNKAISHKSHIEWFILRNRLSTIDAKNKRKVGDALDGLSKRLGFKTVPGLSERVIFRELFPIGLTLLDLDDKRLNVPLSISHVAARQELRDLLNTIGL
jgi:chromosome partitioning protein